MGVGSACHRDNKNAATPRQSRAAMAPIESDADNAKRIAAMLSIHAHARWPESRFPREVSIMDLTEAARFLDADRGALAGSRRRRAIAKLAGYRYAAHAISDDELKGALRTLTGRDPQELWDQLALYVSLHAGDNPPSAEELETAVYDFPQFKDLGVAGCNTETLQIDVPDAGPEASASVDLNVGKGVCAVAAAMDPQSWDVCSKFFKPPERTYLAKLASGTPVPDSPVDPGTPYGGVLGARHLFEDYTCPPGTGGTFTGCDAHLQNLLLVSSWWDSPSTGGTRTYYIRYSLPQGGALSGTVLGVDAHLTADDGGAEVRESSATSSGLSGWKNLRFDNPVLQGMTKGVFTVMVDEIAGEFAELACCPLPEYSTGTPCQPTPIP